MSTDIPLVDYLVLHPARPATLLGQRCDGCGAWYVGRRNGCARCGGNRFTPTELARRGVVRSATTIGRSAPGIPVPYTSVVVDLDGGGALKATYWGALSVEELLGRDVELATRPLMTDAAGTRAIGFGFVDPQVLDTDGDAEEGAA